MYILRGMIPSLIYGHIYSCTVNASIPTGGGGSYPWDLTDCPVPRGGELEGRKVKSIHFPPPTSGGEGWGSTLIGA